jgi:biopolymer transport protein ExbB/TolQ
MNHSSIDSQALDLMLRAGSRWVLWLLIGLSIAAAAVVLERMWFFARSRRQRQHVADMLAALQKIRARSSAQGTGRGAFDGSDRRARVP